MAIVSGEERAASASITPPPPLLAPIAVSMRGGGCYNKNASFQQKAMTKGLSFFLDACGNDKFDDDKMLIVVDYGASEGINSSLPLSTFLDCIFRNFAFPIDIQYLLVDTPMNDFTSLARTMHSAIGKWAEDYPSARIFTQMIGRSFYQQIIPDNHVRFGFSFSCLQWLSQIPTSYLAEMEPTVDRVSLMNFRHEACKAQSDIDLHRFLKARSAEFITGGPLFLSLVGCSSSVTYWEAPAFKCLLLALDDMVESELITSATANSFFPPIFARDLQQVQSILDSPEVKSLWSTMHLCEEDVEHPASSQLERQYTSLENSTRYAQEMIDFGLAIMSTCLIDAIRRHSGTDKITAIDEEVLLLQWKTRATSIFLSQHRDATVQFRWIYAWLKKN